MIPRRLRPARPAPATADAVCMVCGGWMRMPRGASARDRAIGAGFFWADHQHESLEPIIDEVTWGDLAALPRQPCPATLSAWG
jgi:hypothetical protein